VVRIDVGYNSDYLQVILLLFRVLWKISSYSRLFNTGMCFVHILEFCILANSYIVSSGFQNTYKVPKGLAFYLT
jgi:hypothetical protein